MIQNTEMQNKLNKINRTNYRKNFIKPFWKKNIKKNIISRT